MLASSSTMRILSKNHRSLKQSNLSKLRNFKLQYLKLRVSFGFEILNFVRWNLFVIWC